MSGEFYGSWDEIMQAHADVGGQGYSSYHTAFQRAVFTGDASDLEDYAANSGADAASVLCYMHPYYDGQQPGACPSMYFRDTTATIPDIQQHRMWVALEAGSGVVSQHDGQPGKFWSVDNDPHDEDESPLWAFQRYRALNRLGLRTKLNISSAGAVAATPKRRDEQGPSGYVAYPHFKCDLYDGGIPRTINPDHGLTAQQCKQACDTDSGCDCVSYMLHAPSRSDAIQSSCWRFGHCNASLFLNNSATQDSTVFVKKVGPPPAPNFANGALAYLKHDSLGPNGDAALMVFNPGKAAQTVTLDLTLLPPSVFGAVPFNLFSKHGRQQTSVAPLSKKWSVHMQPGEFTAFGGFSLGVFAPRLGKKTECSADDHWSQQVVAETLQFCFLACLREARCANVFAEFIDVEWLEKPPAPRCTLLGELKDPSTACKPGNGTLIKKLPGGRRVEGNS